MQLNLLTWQIVLQTAVGVLADHWSWFINEFVLSKYLLLHCSNIFPRQKAVVMQKTSSVAEGG